MLFELLAPHENSILHSYVAANLAATADARKNFIEFLLTRKQRDSVLPLIDFEGPTSHVATNILNAVHNRLEAARNQDDFCTFFQSLSNNTSDIDKKHRLHEWGMRYRLYKELLDIDINHIVQAAHKSLSDLL